MMRHNPETGKGCSYAEKLKILRDQIQLRKQLHRISKVGGVCLQQHSQRDVEETPVAVC